MSLKIGEVAKLLDMPVETIRFYEKNQVLSPRRKENSTYREYEPWEIFDLFECIGYRNRGFSVREVKRITKEASLSELCERISDKISELDRQYEAMHMRILELKDFKRMAETAKLNVGQYWFEFIPDRISIPCSFSENGEYQDFDHGDARLTEWIKGTPFVKGGVRIEPEEVLNGTVGFEWLFFIEERYLPCLNIDPDDGTQRFPGGTCLCTIVDLGEKGQADPKIIREAVEYACSKGYTCHTAIGELFLRIYEEDGWHRYVKIALPVTKTP